jgi:S-adenosylmethionine-diacylglycerol 3-amino-3-carboxypropyl transferase
MEQVSSHRQQVIQSVSRHSFLSKTGLEERLFAHNFTKLVYPQIWEDPKVDMQALDIQPDDNMVCIASGGCNVLSYMTKEPANITALDLSPAHIALNKLKLAGIRHSPNYRTFFDFFGTGNDASNINIYEVYYRPNLDAQTIKYWESRHGLTKRKIDMFTNGFYQNGVLGRFIKAVHIFAKLNGVDLHEFIECRNLEQQKRYYKEYVEPMFDGKFLKFMTNRKLSLFGLGIPPQQYEELASAANGDMLAVLKERTRALMCDFPLTENYFAWQAFNRGYKDDSTGPLPPYLQFKNLHTLRSAKTNVEYQNKTFTAYLKSQKDKSKNAYVLLDAQDWMTNDQLNDLWQEINRTAAPGARVIFRTAGIPSILEGRVSDKILSNWHYHADQSKALTKQDRSAIYGGFHLYERKG